MTNIGVTHEKSPDGSNLDEEESGEDTGLRSSGADSEETESQRLMREAAAEDHQRRSQESRGPRGKL